MSDGRADQESVEEAVFKYVGVDLQGGKHDEGHPHELEAAENKRQAQARLAHVARDARARAQAQVQAQAQAQARAQAQTQSQVRAGAGSSTGGQDQHGQGQDHDQDQHGQGQDANPVQDQDQDPDQDQDQAAGSADMEWFLRHELGASPSDLDMRGAREPQSVAAAAVAAAFAASQDNKRPRNEDDNGSGRNAASNVSGPRQHHGNKRFKVPDARLAGSRVQSKMPHLGAVDPELASLDDPEDVTEHEQLVRKAILDADSIAHHPDFQHYLNTEDDSDDKAQRMSLLSSKGSTVVLGGIHDHGRKIEVLPKVAGRNSVSGVDSHSGSSPGSGSGPGAGLAARSMGRIPSGMTLGAGAGAGAHSEQDISNMIQDAATKASDFISAQNQSTGKSFDAVEEQALEHFVGDYQAIKNLSRRQICERIWSNERRKDDFWTNICKVLPYRTRSSVYKHVRRKYHIFEQRGKWTPEEDQELAQLCMEKEGQWSEIGKTLGRMPEDCRDRWRNYVKCGNNRASNKWSPQEEEHLKQVISELLDSVEPQDDQSYDTDEVHMDGKAKAGKKKKQDSKDTINWTVVSERMGGTRSRIQCRYKWNKLLKKQAMSKIKSISEDDKTWILEKLRDMGFTEDSQVDWDELATLMPGRQWSGTELKLCYEKLRTGVKYYKDRTINQICKELIGARDEGLPLESESKL
ncbi:KLTH0C07788p [Lachancea thermotolerans CBS 6340]|uniref:KLTH0C07788p n=1 Tax=Lachancea thermotolerans (strain ATCC 56472 / CBS 6340 / NRRL Y-8284) TaxID=559295 RepID=C5DEB3_LACTC|nr:KLTH0C07788p [Lachancea thermotolerans CBS 6340]CAR22124.1 KLTH0C07788p [Lachancea thermotolerans CBS 6340]